MIDHGILRTSTWWSFSVYFTRDALRSLCWPVSRLTRVSFDDGVFSIGWWLGVRENDLCQLASGFQMNIQNNLSAFFIAFAAWFWVSDSPVHAEDRASFAAGLSSIDQAQRTLPVGIRLADNRRFGTGSGWVAAEIDLTPRGNSLSAGQDYREVSRFASSASDQAMDSNSEVSVLERSNEGQPKLNSPIGSTSATPAPNSSLPSTALVGPSNGFAGSPSESFRADSNASASSSEFGASGAAQPLSNMVAAGQNFAPAGNPQVNNLAGSATPIADWFRRFPPFNLNTSVASSETASTVWQDRVRSFFGTPSSEVAAPSQATASSQANARRGWFSAFMPNANTSRVTSPPGSMAVAAGDQAVDQSSVSSAKPIDSVSPNDRAASNLSPLFSLFRGAGQDRYQANRSQLGSTVNNGIPANNVQGTANDPSLQAANAGAQGQRYAAYMADPTAKSGCWNEFLDRWFGTGYRTSSFRVPVTYFRPVITTDPTTGQQVVVQQPCTSFVEQQQRSPIRFFRSARPSQSIPSSSILPSTNPLMNPCPPGYMAAMPSVIYPGVGYAAPANPATAMQQAGYVMTPSGLQSVMVPVGMTMWNGQVVPASAVMGSPAASLSQGNAVLQQNRNGLAQTTLYPSTTSQSAVNQRPLTGADLAAGQNASVDSPSDQTPMPAPRLDAYRYAPAPSTMDRETKANSSNNEERGSVDTEGNPSPPDQRQSYFSAPMRIRPEGNRGDNARWQLQNAADSTALIPGNSGMRQSGAEWESAGDRRPVSGDDRNDPQQVTPSLEDLLRSENFVSAEPIAAPRDYRPSYSRIRQTGVRPLGHTTTIQQDASLPSQPTVVITEKPSETQLTDLTAISIRLHQERESSSDSQISRPWIRQPNSAR